MLSFPDGSDPKVLNILHFSVLHEPTDENVAFFVIVGANIEYVMMCYAIQICCLMILNGNQNSQLDKRIAISAIMRRFSPIKHRTRSNKRLPLRYLNGEEITINLLQIRKKISCFGSFAYLWALLDSKWFPEEQLFHFGRGIIQCRMAKTLIVSITDCSQFIEILDINEDLNKKLYHI